MLNPGSTRSEKIRHILDCCIRKIKVGSSYRNYVSRWLQYQQSLVYIHSLHFLLSVFFIATVPWKSPFFVVKLHSYTNIAAHHVNTFYIFRLKHDDVAILHLTALLNSIYFTRLSLLFQTAEGTPAQQTVKPPQQGRGDGNQSFTKPAKQRPGLKFNETMH